MQSHALALSSAEHARTLPRVRLDKWFFSFAGVTMLACVIVGFEQFYFHGRAYPNREITPPIRSLVIAHGLAMAAWIVLGIVQPMLVATGHRGTHRKLGMFGALLATTIVALGAIVGIKAVAYMPAEAAIMGLHPKQFLAVPVLSVLVFGALVAFAIVRRKTPAIHRSMMFAATMCTISAALNRIDSLNNLYIGTVFETLFGPFFMAVVLAAALWALRCLLVRSFDRWVCVAFGVVTLASLAITAIAKTPAWESVAEMLMRS